MIMKWHGTSQDIETDYKKWLHDRLCYFINTLIVDIQQEGVFTNIIVLCQVLLCEWWVEESDVSKHIGQIIILIKEAII